MSIHSFLMASGSKSSITAQTSVIVEENTNSGSAFIRFLTDGTQVESYSGNEVTIGNWVTPTNFANDWEIRAVLDSGLTPSGTLGTWQDFSVNREWGFTLSALGSRFCTLTFEFRRVGDTAAEYTIAGNSITLQITGPF